MKGRVEGISYREGEVVLVQLGESRTEGPGSLQLPGKGICLVLKSAN